MSSTHSSSDPAAQQRRSWLANAEAWTDAVRTRQIESRRVATDDAVLRAILASAPGRVLDLGCGEGWLCRALSERGADVLGVDASGPLIEAARARGGGAFRLLSFGDVTEEPEQLGGGYDVVVFNFSLLDEEIAPLLAAASSLLAEGGVLVIQTVHPWSACGDQPYRSGWRMERFDAFGAAFPQPMPWYFRTMGDWLGTLRRAGLRLRELREPAHPDTGLPLSLLLLCEGSRGEGGHRLPRPSRAG